MQSFVRPLIARSSTPTFSAPLRSSISHRLTLATPFPVSAPRTPFQAAILFMNHKQHALPKAAAYVAFLTGGQLLAIEWLHNQRGHNPSINTQRVIRRANYHRATQIVLATWVHSTAELPYAAEFEETVEWQHTVLATHGLHLIDNLRLSETGVYSYYGDHNGPYVDSPTYDERSINRPYTYGN